MRTTLDLNDALLVRAKAEAARQRTTLTRLIEEGLKLRLEHEEQQNAPGESRKPFRLRVFGGAQPLRPDIDWTSNAAIYAALDDEYDRRQAGLLPFRDPDDSADWNG